MARPRKLSKEELVLSIDKQQKQIIATLAHHRKLAHYQQLKVWDQQRANTLKLHLQVIEQLNAYIQQKTKESQRYLNSVCRFLADKATQYTRDAENIGTIQTSASETRSDEESSSNSFSPNTLVSDDFAKETHNYLPNREEKAMCSTVPNQQIQDVQRSMCRKLEETDRRQRETLGQIGQFIKIMLDSIQDPASHELEQTLQKICIATGMLCEANIEASESCEELSNGFHKQKNQESPFKSKIDMLKLHNSFMRSAKKQVEAHRKLGQHTIQHLKLSTEVEVNKIKIIRKLLGEYFKMVILLDPELNEQGIKEIDKEEPIEVVRCKLYDPAKVFENDLLSQLKKSLKKTQFEQISIAEVQQYIQELQWMELTNRGLILKQVKAKCRNESRTDVSIRVKSESDIDGLSTQASASTYETWEDCLIFITVDWFLHFYEIDHVPYEKASLNLKVNSNMAVTDVADNQIRIGWETSRSFLSLFSTDQTPQREIAIKLHSEQMKLEFLEYVQI